MTIIALAFANVFEGFDIGGDYFAVIDAVEMGEHEAGGGVAPFVDLLGHARQGFDAGDGFFDYFVFVFVDIGLWGEVEAHIGEHDGEILRVVIFGDVDVEFEGAAVELFGEDIRFDDCGEVFKGIFAVFLVEGNALFNFGGFV